MLKLAEIAFGTVVSDSLTGLKGAVTARFEQMDGYSSVAVEGLDSAGHPFREWVMLERVELAA